MSEAPTLDGLRRFAVVRSLREHQTLDGALEHLGFVQADPIRAPARAQDLTLGHRVRGYRAGDLERHYPTLAVLEDFFVNYGFVTRRVHALMHPRGGPTPWSAARGRLVPELLAFVRARGTVHPREVAEQFARGAVTNYWGGSSNATTHLLDAMHYRGLLRVARREGGVRVYAAHDRSAASNPATVHARLDALVDIIVGKYAPLPAGTLSWFVRRLRLAAPQWEGLLTKALDRARRRLGRARVDGVDWFWPADERPDEAADLDDRVRLLAPFDPVVWDRRRFERFWKWSYRFEAYTPAARRTFGYYALPLLWRDAVIGWANITVDGGRVAREVGYASARAPQDRHFAAALEAEFARFDTFLGVTTGRGLPTARHARRRVTPSDDRS